MRLLLDTHALIWASITPERLSATARRQLQDIHNELHVSLATWWEISIKASKPQAILTLPAGGEERTESYIAGWALNWLPVRTEHCRALRALPWLHRDPFDRMLIAQAQVERLGIVTIDKQFKSYDVKVVLD